MATSKIQVMGEIVTATNYNPSLANQGTATVVSVINLNKGKWIIVASGVSPIISDGNKVVEEPTTFSIKFHDGDTISRASLKYNFCISGIATVTADNTRIDGVVTNWESTAPVAGTNYTMKAIRIA